VDKKKVIETLFDPKVIKILRLFINNPQNSYYLREISKLTKVSPATTFRILNTMKALELIKEDKIKHLKIYVLNQENTVIFSELLEDKRSALQEFGEFIRSVAGIELVVLHGKEEKDKASILIVGTQVDQEVIRTKIFELKQKYAFSIIHLVLAPDQYDQMVSMGLYPGKKVVLYSNESITSA
jgi:DNA-binding MarR family transcriptional regulator